MSMVLPPLLDELPPLDAAALLLALLLLLLLPQAAMASTAPTTSKPVDALPRTDLIQPPRYCRCRTFHGPVTAQRSPLVGRRQASRAHPNATATPAGRTWSGGDRLPEGQAAGDDPVDPVPAKRRVAVGVDAVGAEHA